MLLSKDDDEVAGCCWLTLLFTSPLALARNEGELAAELTLAACTRIVGLLAVDDGSAAKKSDDGVPPLPSVAVDDGEHASIAKDDDEWVGVRGWVPLPPQQSPQCWQLRLWRWYLRIPVDGVVATEAAVPAALVVLLRKIKALDVRCGVSGRRVNEEDDDSVILVLLSLLLPS